MPESGTARFLTESEFSVWDDLVKRSPAGTFFDSSAWLQLISSATGGEFRVIVCFDEGVAVGGCACYMARTSARKTVSPPLLTRYQGILVAGSAEAGKQRREERRNAGIIGSIAEVAEREFSSIRLVHHPALHDVRPLLWRGWRASPKYTYVLNLHSSDRIEADWDSAFRTRVAKARQANIKVGTSDDAELFYSLWEKGTARAARKLPVSRDRFGKIFSELVSAGYCTMYVSSVEEGTPVAARIVLVDGDAAYDWIAGADPQYSKTGAVELLLSRILAELSGRVSWYDLCGADTPGAASFKSALCGELVLHFQTEKACSRSAKVSDSIVFVGRSFLKGR